MTANKLHAVAAALLLGAATLSVGAILASAPAYAAVRAEVGAPLQQAEQAAQRKDYKTAMDDIAKAEAVSNKTAEETSMISQIKQYVGTLSGDVALGGAAAAKVKLNNDYTARNYAAVIADADAMKKGGGLDANTMAVVAQSYYLMGNKAGCVKYIKDDIGAAADESTLQVEMKCAFDSNDDADQRDALEQLVAKTGKAEYWTALFKLANQAKNLTDHQSLDIYRLKYLTGTMAGKDDYINMAQLCLQLGFPGEASAVMDKGTAAGLLNDDRSKKLQALAKQQAGAAQGGMAATTAAAQKDPNGDALVKIAEQQWGNGDAKGAVLTAKAAQGKNLKDKDQAVIVLGLAQATSGQSADAIKTLNADKGDGNGPMIAHLYGIYAAHPNGAAAAAPAETGKKKRK